MPLPLRLHASVPFVAILACLFACSDSGGARTGLPLDTTNGGAGGTSSGKGGSTTGGDAGAGSGGQSGAGASGGGTSPSGGAAGNVDDDDDEPGVYRDFASLIRINEIEPSPCADCLRAHCAAENAACGNLGTSGHGPCKPATECIAASYRETDPNFDCAFVTCAAANPIEPVNDMFICVADHCATECYVTKNFASCDG